MNLRKLNYLLFFCLLLLSCETKRGIVLDYRIDYAILVRKPLLWEMPVSTKRQDLFSYPISFIHEAGHLDSLKILIMEMEETQTELAGKSDIYGLLYLYSEFNCIDSIYIYKRGFEIRQGVFKEKEELRMFLDQDFCLIKNHALSR